MCIFNSCFFVFYSVVALAQHVCRVRLVRKFWRTWSSALHDKRREEDRSRAVGLLAVQSTQRRALEYWKACILNIKTVFSFSRWLNHPLSNSPHCCWVLELVSRCDIVQKRASQKQDCKSTSSSSSLGEREEKKKSSCTENLIIVI